MVILRQRFYATAVATSNGNIELGANAGPRSQSYYDELEKSWGNADTNAIVQRDSAARVGRVDATRNLGGQEVYQKTPLTGQQSYNLGKNSVTGWNGAKTWAKNTWNNMGTGGKIATGAAAGAAVLGTGALIANSIKNRRKAKEAEEELREEKRRRR